MGNAESKTIIIGKFIDFFSGKNLFDIKNEDIKVHFKIKR